MSFGSRLKELRKKAQLSQADFGNAIGVSCTAISQYESDNRFPDQEIFKAICYFFNVSADYLLEMSSIQSPPMTSERIVIACEKFTKEQIEIINVLVRAFNSKNNNEVINV